MARHDNPEKFGDAHFEALFSTLNRDLADAEFRVRVMRRVRDMRLRRAARIGVVAAAAAIGVVAAFGPLLELLVGAFGGLSDLWAALRSANGSAALDWAEMYRLPALVAALCLAAWPVLARWIAR
jgi:hypothetical protein